MPESNFASERKRGSPQPTQEYTPVLWLSWNIPQKGRSVPCDRATAYCSGVSRARHSSSLLTIVGTLLGSVSDPSAASRRTVTSSGGCWVIGLALLPKVLAPVKTTKLIKTKPTKTSAWMIKDFIVWDHNINSCLLVGLMANSLRTWRQARLPSTSSGYRLIAILEDKLARNNRIMLPRDDHEESEATDSLLRTAAWQATVGASFGSEARLGHV